VWAGATQAGPLRRDHPLIGTWKFTLPDGSCSEVYQFTSEGTTFVTSGEEQSRSDVEVSDQLTPQGFYKWVDKVTWTNGKKDCGGNIMPVGDTATSFILLHPSGTKLLMCGKEDMNECLGPVFKQPASG
jgi:hypothetical protein